MTVPNPTQYTKSDIVVVKPKNRNLSEMEVYINCRIFLLVVPISQQCVATAPEDISAAWRHDPALAPIVSASSLGAEASRKYRILG